MSASEVFLLGVKVVTLTIILASCMTVGASVSGVSALPAPNQSLPTGVGDALLSLLVCSCLQATVLTWIILRSSWYGWKLVGAVFLAFFGLNSVVTHIESIIYLPPQLPPGMIPRLLLMGAITAALFSPLAVSLAGKMKHEKVSPTPLLRLEMSLASWVWRLAAIALAYVILYFTFGYFIAWKNAAVLEYYGGTDAGNLFAQLASIWSATPWRFGVQALRGLLWAAFTLPVIKMHKGGDWELGLMIAWLYSVWSSQLLLPDQYLPEAVARTHFVETVLTDFIFGWVVAWLLRGRDLSLREFGRRMRQGW